MRYSETNMRVGNSGQHPIKAVYWQTGTPFKILQVQYPPEYYTKDSKAKYKPRWYRVQDFQGETGWIKSNQLVAMSRLMILSGSDSESVFLYENADSNQKRAQLPNNLIVRKLSCIVNWCEVSFQSAVYGRIKGWVEKVYLWGDVNS